MINESWAWRPLGELFEIGAGKTMSADARDGADKTPFLRTSNVLWDDIDLSTVDDMMISERELQTKLLRPGDLLVCEGGEIGRAAIWTGLIERMSFQNHLHRLRPQITDVEPHFYVYFLQAAFTQLGIFEGVGNKTTIPNLSRNRLAALTVPHPPLDEQRAITSALAWVRKAIKTHDLSTAAARELKRATTSHLYTRGLRGEDPKETEIGPMPQSWAAERLDRHANVISTRMSYSELEKLQSSDEEGSVTVLGIKVADMNLPGNEVELKSAVLQKAVSKAIAKRRCAPPQTIVFPKRGAAIATNKKRISSEWAAFDPNVIGVVGGSRLDQRFLFQWFQTFDLRTITEPGPTPQLNKKNLEPLIIPVPSTLDEQRGIASILETIDHKINLHRHKRAVLDDLFRVLLFKLMTGEIHIDQLDLSALSSPTEKAA